MAPLTWMHKGKSQILGLNRLYVHILTFLLFFYFLKFYFYGLNSLSILAFLTYIIRKNSEK